MNPAFNFLRGINNEHLELARLLWAISVFAGIVYAGANLAINHVFSIVEFGTGMGILMAGGGGSVAIKDRQTVTSRVIQETGVIPARGTPSDQPPGE